MRARQCHLTAAVFIVQEILAQWDDGVADHLAQELHFKRF